MWVRVRGGGEEKIWLANPAVRLLRWRALTERFLRLPYRFDLLLSQPPLLSPPGGVVCFLLLGEAMPTQVVCWGRI